MSLKAKTIWISIIVTASLTAVKAAVGFLTMSISVLASALDSFMDVCSMSINLAAVRTSEKPADETHPFGHGKAEAIAGLMQALFILVSATFLIIQAFHRMVDGYKLEDESIGIVVMVIATIASIFLAKRLKSVGDNTESSALKAGALNFAADIWTNMGVLIALGLERIASIRNADPIVSVLISIYIATSAIRVGHEALTQLMDKALPEEALTMIDRFIKGHGPLVKGYHRLKTRRVGAEKYIEFHLEIDREASFEEARNVTEAIISDIRLGIPNANVIVHSDPV